MNKKILLWFVLGWLFAAIFSPGHVIGMFSAKKSA